MANDKYHGKDTIIFWIPTGGAAINLTGSSRNVEIDEKGTSIDVSTRDDLVANTRQKIADIPDRTFTTSGLDTTPSASRTWRTIAVGDTGSLLMYPLGSTGSWQASRDGDRRYSWPQLWIAARQCCNMEARRRADQRDHLDADTMTAFPRIHEDATCPLSGYEGYTFRVLANPTGSEKQDWSLGHLGIAGCPDCARLGTQRGKAAKEMERRYCAACQEARDRMARASMAIFGDSRVDGFDFSSPAASLATFERDDLPDELLLWLYMLPAELWAARIEAMKKQLPFSSKIGS
jgi:hypothetical protein